LQRSTILSIRMHQVLPCSLRASLVRTTHPWLIVATADNSYRWKQLQDIRAGIWRSKHSEYGPGSFRNLFTYGTTILSEARSHRSSHSFCGWWNVPSMAGDMASGHIYPVLHNPKSTIHIEPGNNVCVCDWWSNHIQLWSWDPAQYAGPETDETNDETIKMVSMMFHLKGLKDTTSPKHSKTVYTSFPVDQISFGSDLVVFTWRTKNPGPFPSASQDSAFPCSQRSQPVEYDCFSPQSTAERCHRLHYGYPMLSSKPNELRFFPKLQYTNWIKLGPLPGAYANHSSDAKLPTRGLPFKKCLRGCLHESCCSDLFTWRDEVTILVQKRIVRWIGRWRFFGWLVKGRRKLHAWSTKGHVIGSHDELMETFGWATRENFMVAR